jgi:hypothetical protein
VPNHAALCNQVVSRTDAQFFTQRCGKGGLSFCGDTNRCHGLDRTTLLLTKQRAGKAAWPLATIQLPRSLRTASRAGRESQGLSTISPPLTFPALARAPALQAAPKQVVAAQAAVNIGSLVRTLGRTEHVVLVVTIFGRT